jgi:hypothetical protein
MVDGYEHSLPNCSVKACPQQAIIKEVAESKHWRIAIRYCAEHARELREGIPLGPVGLDPSCLEIEPVGTKEPDTGGTLHAIGPQ